MKTMLMERLRCNETRAGVIENDLQALSPELQPLLDRWIKDGLCEDDTPYGGYSLNDLVKKSGFHFTGALLTLDWILKEPEAALKALAEPVR